jgi:hypothetical protein
MRSVEDSFSSTGFVFQAVFWITEINPKAVLSPFLMTCFQISVCLKRGDLTLELWPSNNGREWWSSSGCNGVPDFGIGTIVFWKLSPRGRQSRSESGPSLQIGAQPQQGQWIRCCLCCISLQRPWNPATTDIWRSNLEQQSTWWMDPWCYEITIGPTEKEPNDCDPWATWQPPIVADQLAGWIWTI